MKLYAPYPDAAARVTVTFVENRGKTTLTSTVLHDEAGPIGTVAQTLTVRPIP